MKIKAEISFKYLRHTDTTIDYGLLKNFILRAEYKK